MAVRIRLKKMGRRHRPYYRICVMDSRAPRDGRSIEDVGTYDPMIRDTDQRVTMKHERVDYWLGVGALPTETVQRLIEKYKGKVPEARTERPKDKAIPDPTPILADPKEEPKTEEAAAEGEAPAEAAAEGEAPKEGEAAPAEASAEEKPAEEAPAEAAAEEKSAE
ncbi:30S ribosomal protein S16 [Planctomycetes bacterium Pan216]|uniref:Small ribosomal subunit protein bS16 n=1 Tax=Kolteria novifilia TaxID=2527975 RepID=A0A518AXD4_9BACT|nr:30S ribosomal protein S16 [Planctomycetes bacterium Pan216]